MTLAHPLIGDAAGVHDEPERHLRLAFRRPLCPDNLFGHLAATAVPGVEEWRDGAYRRTLRLPHGSAIVALAPRAGRSRRLPGRRPRRLPGNVSG